jgi:glycine dehydrogenase
VADDVHPQTLAVLQTRAEPLGIRILTGPAEQGPTEPVFAALFQYPGTDGSICDLEKITVRTHAAGALAIVATDLLAVTLLKPPGECGADVVIGSSQR